MNLAEWKSFRVKQGMRSSHGEVVAVTVGRAEMLTILAHCSVLAGQGPLGAASHCAQNDIAHCAQQCTEGGGDPGWRLPPLPPGADAEVFAQREHLSLS